ncbi:MAG: mechanosensitive ion channel family protein [Rhizobiaceae bacterium]
MLLVVVGGSQAQQAHAQEELARDFNLHRIANTSSPRDTLRSFEDLSRDLIRTWHAGGADDRVYVLLKGLQETLDFSTTTNGAESVEHVRRILLLRETLDRIVLPPWQEIPNQEDVANGVREWIIPGTRLRIGQLGTGTRAGEFVFTAGTVENLHLTYKQVEQVPYQPGAVPVLEKWESANKGQFAVAGNLAEDGLRSIDRSSPRAVLIQFLHHANVAYQLATEAEKRVSATPATLSIEEAQAVNKTAMAHIMRASSAFDLSRIPKSQRDNTRLEATIMLKEIFDRVVLPPIEEIPDLSELQRTDGQNGPVIWQYPGLPIRIVQVAKGDNVGAFAFDPATLERLAGIYNRLKDQPYKSRLALRGEWEYSGSDAISPGFYDFYISTPGNLVPSASLLGRMVGWLPDWAKTVHHGQTVWQWAGLVLSGFAALVAGIAIPSLLSRTARERSNLAAIWILTLSPLAVMVVVSLIGSFGRTELNLTGDVLEWFIIANRIILLALSAWLIWQISAALAASVIATRWITKGSIDAKLVRVLFGIAAIMASVTAAVAGLRDIGVDAVPLIAGLGVGGLAVALAIRPTLENLIGGLILHSDRPLRVGDYCTIGEMTGIIESIGVRSTQIRGLDRTLISIPNSRLADMDIVNWAHCDRMLIKVTLGLRYETTPDQLRHLLANIRRMLHAHPKIDRNTIRVRYAGPGASSRDINIRIYVLTRDWNEFHAVREDVFLRIDDLVEESGVAYAYPTQTFYSAKDQMPDEDRIAAAEAEVAAWRDSEDLPFPRLDRRTMDELEGTLDYPPQGSNKSVHGEELITSTSESLSAETEKSRSKRK